MNGVNKVILVGTLGSDPKNITSRDGRQFTTLSLATNRYWKNKEGAVTRRTDWHRVMVWGKKGNICQTYLKKGSPVCIEGYLSTYETEEQGQKKFNTAITAEDINFLPIKKEAEAQIEAAVS